MFFKTAAKNICLPVYFPTGDIVYTSTKADNPTRGGNFFLGGKSRFIFQKLYNPAQIYIIMFKNQSNFIV